MSDFRGLRNTQVSDYAGLFVVQKRGKSVIREMYELTEYVLTQFQDTWVTWYKNTLGVGTYVLITGEKYTVDTRTVFQEMVLITNMFLEPICSYNRLLLYNNTFSMGGDPCYIRKYTFILDTTKTFKGLKFVFITQKIKLSEST